MIKFHDVKTSDRELIQSYTLCGDRQNCDLSFANIISWRFLYNTQIAEVDGFLVFRFYTGHHLAYMHQYGNVHGPRLCATDSLPLSDR